MENTYLLTVDGKELVILTTSKNKPLCLLTINFGDYLYE